MTQHLFECHDIEQNAQALADFLPNGKLFVAKNFQGSVYRMFLRGLARTNFEFEQMLCLLDADIDIATTTLLLDGWERTVGIPDCCFTSEGKSLDERRQQVLVKLAALGVQTEADFITLAAIFGVDISIGAGIDHGAFTYTFPIVFFDSVKEARFTMIVFYAINQAYTFPYRFPLQFGSAAIPLLQCLFEKLVPANVNVIFLQEFEAPIFVNGGFSSGFSSGFN